MQKLTSATPKHPALRIVELQNSMIHTRTRRVGSRKVFLSLFFLLLGFPLQRLLEPLLLPPPVAAFLIIFADLERLP